ncbi:gephyrin-like molybdotransferase Glp [Rhodoplanes roseus]|uniref:Molybdopterin molybdenumtransferase n=1 Tax=Rhodoplanes roseus TaxID=29409 RepID=A0A327KW40_9BRAD|nr:gephyrin-like molybdotransferase Glp [Rhodoplanes roseus]RAI42427.1 molybdopterin molybdenumtransferase MoeA [Rhodoplanes roseus]
MAAPLSVADALFRVVEHAAPLPGESAPLAQAHGRVLAADLAALRTQPPDDLSAMDGYAVRAADVTAPNARLTVIGEVPAGRPFDGTVGPGEAARIFTGGVMPAGADTVVVQENATRDGDTVVFGAASLPGRHVRRKGRDFAAGSVLLHRGRKLTMRDLALAAAMNHPAVPVHRRPRVGLLATGDELVPPGTEPGPGRIVYSNGFAIGALARSEGAETLDLGIVPDRLDETVAAIRRARAEKVDVLVTTGGASVGDYDLVQKALAAEGMALAFWKIAMRPGRPLMSGRLGDIHVLGLPGNPVSSFVTAVLFLVPLLRRLQGRDDLSLADEVAVAGADLKPNDERTDYLRATLASDPEGRLVATPVTDQDSSLLAPLGLAGGLLVRPPHAPAVTAGGPCRVIRLPA